MAENLSTSGSEDENSGDDVDNVVRAGEIVNVTKIKGERKDSELYKTGDMFLFHTATLLAHIIHRMSIGYPMLSIGYQYCPLDILWIICASRVKDCKL